MASRARAGSQGYAIALFDFWASARDLMAVNAEGTRNLVRALVEVGVPELVNISSASVYWKRYRNKLCSEGDVPAPADKYARSKWAQELAVAQRPSPAKLRVVSLRPGAIYGPGSHYGDAIALYLLKKGLLFCVPGLTKIISSHVQVKDVCHAAIHLGSPVAGMWWRFPMRHLRARIASLTSA